MSCGHTDLTKERQGGGKEEQPQEEMEAGAREREREREREAREGRKGIEGKDNTRFMPQESPGLEKGRRETQGRLSGHENP